jgi:RNA polymerase sigma-70 factor (ECF subfamily)
MNESKILRKAQQGDPEAFSALFEKYKDFVWNVVYRMVFDFDEAEDIAQEVFVTAWRRLGSFRADSAFSTWLYRLTVNKTLNHLRNRRNNLPLSDEAVTPNVDAEVFMRQNPEASIDELEAEQVLALLLARLDPDKRLAVILRELEGLSY